jgi:photosystem II stability/assembly factor-like uncharacterized protein
MSELPNPEGFTLNGTGHAPAGAIPVRRTRPAAARGRTRPAVHGRSPAIRHQPVRRRALREGPLLLLGLRGKVFRSAAPGAPWVEIQTPVDASLFAGLQLADGTVLLVGAAGQVLRSHDQGQSFTAQPMKTRFPFTGAAVAPDGAVVLAGTRGVLRLQVAGAPPTVSPRNNKEARDGKL